MNVHTEYWEELGYSREELHNPEINIQAGVELLGRIKERMPDATPAELATIYNSLGEKEVSDYGARIEELLKEKPWENKKE